MKHKTWKQPKPKIARTADSERAYQCQNAVYW